jgi:hypothetical protein
MRYTVVLDTTSFCTDEVTVRTIESAVQAGTRVVSVKIVDGFGHPERTLEVDVGRLLTIVGHDAQFNPRVRESLERDHKVLSLADYRAS